MKFTLIMPTYNDASTLEETLKSILNQDYQNWELLISDDGSTDNTKEIIENFIKTHKEKRIKYYYEPNQDQLNAILNVLKNITGDYVYVIHSDDLICFDALTKANSILKDNPNLDALITDYYIINDKSQIVSYNKVNEYQLNKNIPPLMLLWLGRNLYVDVAFHKTGTFITKVKENYLLWNRPFWLNEDHTMLNVKNAHFASFKYRISPTNYINNPLGKLNVLNGEIRTSLNLMQNYHIPLYKLQYYLFRLFNKFHLAYSVFYFNTETKNKYQVLKFIIKKRYKKEEYKSNIYLNSLLLFFKNYQNRAITISKIASEDIYYGKDIRKFNQALLNNNLPEIYLYLFKEMEKGFNKIIVNSKKDYENITIITKFLCLNPFINIELKETF